MKARLGGLLVVSIAILAGLVSMPNLMAQAKAKAAPKAEKKAAEPRQNVQGTVQDMGKGTSMITIRNGTKTQQVAYNSSTKFLYGHTNDAKPGSVAQIKTSYYISCVAALDGKKELMASECVYRETK